MSARMKSANSFGVPPSGSVPCRFSAVRTACVFNASFAAADSLSIIADGVPEVLRVVRQQIAAGADWIKMYASTGTDDDVTGFQTYNYDEIKAAVDAAHQFGKKIAN